ncbi:MAG TPA: allantoicase [Kofleriaceae bacterium]|nr:allantoicase [Kofleriaceae bacterium]
MSNEAAFLDLPDLACEDVGGAALSCNDEFFAEKENLLKAAPAVWKDHLYTDRGKWMDGWETRRRREAGYDWCIVRLGLPGVIRGVVVDTAFFRGNFPAEASLEGCELDDPLDLAALAHASWLELLPRSALAGDAKNGFAIAHDGRITHLRLNIFPDGGVARLRVHGVVAPRWSRLRTNGLVDLAALEHGGWVESCSDMFFGSRNNLIKPGPSRTMADGWETRRRRGPGHDWALVRLAHNGVVERLEVDTSHFKGNAPGRCLVEGMLATGASTDGEPVWRPILSSPLQPHTRHLFEDELRRVGTISHLRLSVFPDGGVARLRAWGTPTAAADGGLDTLNRLDADEARAAFLRCCGSRAWAEAMVGHRPFEDAAALLRIGERTWWHLGLDAWLEAFAAHPKIGEAPAAAHGAWAGGEQAGAAGASTGVKAALAAANVAYAEQHGFIYIVCATGRSAEEMLADLKARLGNDRDAEIRIAAEEQAKITRLRLRKLLGEAR